MWTLYDSYKQMEEADTPRPLKRKPASGPDSGKTAQSTLARTLFLLEPTSPFTRRSTLQRKAS